MYYTCCDFPADFFHYLRSTPENSQTLRGGTLYDQLGKLEAEVLWAFADILGVVSFIPIVYTQSLATFNSHTLFLE